MLYACLLKATHPICHCVNFLSAKIVALNIYYRYRSSYCEKFLALLIIRDYLLKNRIER